MPNYKKEIESYRCGDLFQFPENKHTIYILSQVDYGLCALISLDDLSNRISDLYKVQFIDKISSEEFCKITKPLKHLGYAKCIGSINDFDVCQKNN